MKRVLKTRTFARWAKDLLDDCQLCVAAREIEEGRFEADLGAGLCKKRIAVAGRGKRGGTRALVAKRHAEAIIFLVGRTKNEPGTDFTKPVVDAAKALALWFEGQTLVRLEGPMRMGELMEICHEQQRS
jgi:hypothetical protein